MLEFADVGDSVTSLARAGDVATILALTRDDSLRQLFVTNIVKGVKNDQTFSEMTWSFPIDAHVHSSLQPFPSSAVLFVYLPLPQAQKMRTIWTASKTRH